MLLDSWITNPAAGAGPLKFTFAVGFFPQGALGTTVMLVGVCALVTSGEPTMNSATAMTADDVRFMMALKED
jgi:hypothetical protein